MAKIDIVRKFEILRWIFVLLQIIVILVFYSRLPDAIPTHWNFRGEVDGYSSREFGAFFIPILSSLMLLLFKVLPKIDPKSSNYDYFEKEWQYIQTSIALFFTVLHILIIYVAIGNDANVGEVVVVMIGLLFIVFGRTLKRVRQNFFIGIRTPWSLSSEENWKRTHQVASITFTVGGFLAIFLAFFNPVAVLVVLIASGLIPVFYSFYSR